jgi:molybdenum cofactor cytidylyltransferase
MIAGLILAAGESSRMGRDKALLEYRGRSFLQTAVATLKSAGIASIVVVLGHHAEEIRRALILKDVQIVVNENYSLGQTSSLQAGLCALANQNVDAVILWLVDHPAIQAETVKKLAAEFQNSKPPVIIPRYQGERGHPVLISRALFDELLDLTPQDGANTVIRKHRNEAVLVDVDDPGIGQDIDDPDSYQGLRS